MLLHLADLGLPALLNLFVAHGQPCPLIVRPIPADQVRVLRACRSRGRLDGLLLGAFGLGGGTTYIVQVKLLRCLPQRLLARVLVDHAQQCLLTGCNEVDGVTSNNSGPLGVSLVVLGRVLLVTPGLLILHAGRCGCTGSACPLHPLGQACPAFGLVVLHRGRRDRRLSRGCDRPGVHGRRRTSFGRRILRRLSLLDSDSALG